MITNSATECLEMSKERSTPWFSYKIQHKICILFYSCPELTEVSNYISGQKECETNGNLLLLKLI